MNAPLRRLSRPLGVNGTPPRLTTRRLDAFNDAELAVLSEAATNPTVWLIHGKHIVEAWQAAYVLQRLGYLWPTTREKPETGGNFALGFAITDDGRKALSIALKRKAS